MATLLPLPKSIPTPMKKNLPFISFLLTLILLSACGGEKSAETSETTTDTAPNVVGEEVSYQLDTLEMKGYLAYDASSTEKRPGVLVVHEWWGHNDYARKRADMLAELGYVALAVDMYGDGKNAEHPQDAGKFASEALSRRETAQARFEQALSVLKANASTDVEKIAAIGYCFGGSVVLEMARAGMDLDGVISFHGGLSTRTPAEKGVITAKVLVHNGADDPFVPAQQIEAFKAEMDSAAVDYEFVSHEGATHSFTNPDSDTNGEKFGMPLAYNAAADSSSWASTQAFFREIFN